MLRANDHQRPKGALVVSLDFELYWGLRDVVPLDRVMRQRLLRTRAVIPRLLSIFEERSIRATWATVGMLFADSLAELSSYVPKDLPSYQNSQLSPYLSLSSLGRDEESDPFHFAGSIIEGIHGTRGQELGSHTFSHYYALAEGQTARQFAADLAAARAIAGSYGNVLHSLVLPRNQWNPEYAQVLTDAGVSSVRVNREWWALRPSKDAKEPLARRVARLSDSFFPLSGDLATPRQGARQGGLMLQTASAFFRIFDNREYFTLPGRLQQRRLAVALSDAAESTSLLHIWLHPHNLGGAPDRSLSQLQHFLDEFTKHRERGGLESWSMSDVFAAVAPPSPRRP